VRRAAAGIAAAATALPSVDAVIFGGGIGQNSSVIRARIVDRLAVIGLSPLPPSRPDADLDSTDADRVLSAPNERPAVLRIATREDLSIATAAANLVRA
jgi:acetate kinase